MQKFQAEIAQTESLFFDSVYWGQYLRQISCLKLILSIKKVWLPR